MSATTQEGNDVTMETTELIHKKKLVRRKSKYLPWTNDHFSLLYSVYVLFLLLFIYICSVMGRLVLSILLPYVKKQLNLTDEQVGLLNGPLYSVIYCIFGLIFGKFGEGFPRKLIIFISVLSSNIMICATGFSWNYWFLLLCRLAFAAAVSGASSCTVPFLADFFPPYYRASMQAVYNWGIFIGMGVSYAVGGLENSEHTNSKMWRYVLYFMAVPGTFAAFLFLFTVKEPIRGRFEQLMEKEITYKDDILSIDDYEGVNVKEELHSSVNSQKIIFRQYVGTLETFSYLIRRPTFIYVCLAGSCRTFAGLAMANWLPQFFERDVNINSITQAKWLSWIIPLGGVSGFIFGGYLSDYWTKRNERAGAYIAFLSCLFSLPFTLGALLINHPIVAMLFMFPNMMVSEVWTGSAGAVILSILPVCMRNLSYSIYYFTLSIIGGFGPLLIGHLATHYKFSLRFSMIIVLPIFYFAASCFFLLSAFNVKRDIYLKNSWEYDNMDSKH
jgi:MFS family permease